MCLFSFLPLCRLWNQCVAVVPIPPGQQCVFRRSTIMRSCDCATLQHSHSIHKLHCLRSTRRYPLLEMNVCYAQCSCSTICGMPSHHVELWIHSVCNGSRKTIITLNDRARRTAQKKQKTCTKTRKITSFYCFRVARKGEWGQRAKMRESHAYQMFIWIKI